MMYRGKKLAALILCAAMVIGLIPWSLNLARAEGKTITGLGTGAISNPASGAGGWSKVYFGSKDSPILFNVLTTSTGNFGGTTMLLDCASILQHMKFDNDGDPNTGAQKANEWAFSDIRTWLNGTFLTDRFTTVEASAIAESTKAEKGQGDGDGWSGFLGYAPLNKDQVFLLDAVEATNTDYGFENKDTSSNTRIKKLDNSNDQWWLRSPYSSDGQDAGIVHDIGALHRNRVYGENVGVSPALNVNLSSVIFSSLISGTAGSAGAEYKLTLADTSRTVSVTSGKTLTRNSTTSVTVPYTIDSVSNYVSLLITNKDDTWSAESGWSAGAVKQYYTTAAMTTATGTVTFTLPDDYETNKGNWKVWILAEQVNAGNATDYASAPVAITIPEMKTFTVADISSLTYQGAAINVPLTVKDANSGTVLTKNTDYTVSFQIKSGSAWNDTGDVLDAGEYKAIVEGMGFYSGTRVEKAFTVGKADLTITARDQRYVYNGQPQGETDPVYEDQAVISQKVAVSGLKGGDLISSIIITGQETEIGEYNGVIEITGVGITRDGESVKDNYSITLVSGKLTITKTPQDAPAAPTVESITESSVTLKATDGYQYSKDGTNWQDSPVFTGLKSNTQYTFYQRVAEDDNHMPSPASEGTAITTGSKIYTVTKTEGTEHTIGSGENAVYKVERNVDDEEKTFANFSGAAVDGAAIPAGGSTAAPGSLILTLKSSYLDTLAPGEHKVTISFADGTAEAPLTIRAAAPTPAPRPVPQTGDRDNPVLWIGVVLLGLAGLAALAAVKASRKRK